jgi:hypothetical protein
MVPRKYYYILLVALICYILAQTFQQYWYITADLSPTAGIEERLTAELNSLSYVRHVLILLSMFLMIPAFLVLCLHFYKRSLILSVLAGLCFFCFLFIEVSFRSVNFFYVMMNWGEEFMNTQAADKVVVISRFEEYYRVLNALYFPLLLFFFGGSVLTAAMSKENKSDWPLTVAMVVNALLNLSRLMRYTPFAFLNIVTMEVYYVGTMTAFGLMVLWVVRIIKQQSPSPHGKQL